MSDVQSFERIVEDPVGAYEAMQRRLHEQGPNAPFPEFQPAVDYVNNALAAEEHQAVLAQHPALELEKKETETILAHINLVFDFDDEDQYPYGRPFDAPLPYRPTIDAIESGLRLLDKYARLKEDSDAVPLYHFDRYAYHRHSLLADPNVVLMPTAAEITYADFIRTRAVPIGFIGLTGTTIRVDRHQQSPLDFWYHDLNHVRRMAGYLKQSETAHGAVSMEDKLALYKSMDTFIQDTLMPAIADLPADASEEDIAVRRLMRTILFEVLHETALTPERDSIVGDILRESIPQPFEHMVTKTGRPTTADETEKLRTPTGNLQSGVSTLGEVDGAPITVRYFNDRALGLLANVYNKLTRGFYDNPDSPSEFVAPTQHRTPDQLEKAARELLMALKCPNIPSNAHLLDIIQSRAGSEEKFVYQGVAGTEGENSPYATEPLPADEIIQLIKDLDKRIVTLFGFSYLGYEHPEQMLEQVTNKLQQLNPETDAINIGATKEGIGAAYDVAKKMGFMTLGVVSTLALTYSGRFSNQVDRIYIVNDERWGGYDPRTQQLAGTTRAYLEVSNEIHAFGGGDNTAVILKEAQERGIPISYAANDMNHEIGGADSNVLKVLGKARYKGSAFQAWQHIQQS